MRTGDGECYYANKSIYDYCSQIASPVVLIINKFINEQMSERQTPT